MSFPHISEDLKGVSVRIGGMCFTAEAVLRLCIDGFIGHKAELIDGAQERTVSLNEEGNQLRKLLRDKATERTGNKEQIKYLLATLSSVRLALNGLDSLSRHVKFKIDEKIILSDKGFDEIRYLFHASLDILKSAGDTIANRKESFMKYVMDKCANLEILARQYAERHEERLITGICLPDASPVYVCIVDSVLTVVWHIKNAVTRLFGKW
ncbi:MAG: hypothetical protein B6D35_13650 [Candidatus Brocadia sp. UTAMX2]|jgi:Na+/phosphate symporter|nr:MAG: hypothetical protein B6D35_13650 [Candidatus Brocadia sp. UTAMX2]